MDDRQKTVAFGAYYTLHRLVPDLPGPPPGWGQFNAHTGPEIARSNHWWDRGQQVAGATINPSSSRS